MSNRGSAVTRDPLDVKAAKALVAFLEKPRKGKDTWRPWSGEGGAQIAESFEGLTLQDLAAVQLPGYCRSLEVWGKLWDKCYPG